MTSTLRHIQDLDMEAWAALSKRASVDAVAAAKRLGITPPAVLTVMAAMSERELVDHRNRYGPGRQRLSPVMQLVEADHLRALAEARAGEAQQASRDAEAGAAMARAEAEQSAQAATAAQERARTVQTEAAHKDRERAAALGAVHEALEGVRAELEQVRADAATELAAAQEQVRAAQARADQRA
ncbi:MAG: hypothetical protein QOH91_4650, partial [Mycobacterium sp.]|nr:hypothetical protein [Mycobacterium sp.]